MKSPYGSTLGLVSSKVTNKLEESYIHADMDFDRGEKLKAYARAVGNGLLDGMLTGYVTMALITLPVVTVLGILGYKVRKD